VPTVEAQQVQELHAAAARDAAAVPDEAARVRAFGAAVGFAGAGVGR
jgi:hypothetical protein